MADSADTLEVEAVNGATSTANWWAHETKQTRAAAHRKTKLVRALNSEAHEPVRTALANGRLLCVYHHSRAHDFARRRTQFQISHLRGTETAGPGSRRRAGRG